MIDPYILVEGAVDAFCGRPRDQNPYARQWAPDEHRSWDFGWEAATELLQLRGREEAARWLREAA